MYVCCCSVAQSRPTLCVCVCVYIYIYIYFFFGGGGFPGSSDGKESACNVGDPGSIPGLGRFPGEGNGYPLQYSGLGNSMDSMGSQKVGHD